MHVEEVKRRVPTSRTARLAFGLMLIGTQAHATQYVCTMKHVSRDGFVSKAMLLDIRSDREAWVYDNAVHAVHNGPIKVKLSGSEDTRWTLKWTLVNIPMSAGAQKSGPTQYTATFKPGNGSITVRVILSGFDNSPRGSGRCARKEE